MAQTFKKSMNTIHLWLGLISGLIVFIVALTGSILVFEKEIDQIINKDYYTVSKIETTKLPVDESLAVLKKEYNIKKIVRVYAYNDPKRTVQVMAKDNEGETQLFSINPYTGQVMASVAQKSRFFSVVLDIHRRLLMDDFGKFITGCSCLMFVFILISGFILWWPKKIKNLKQRLTVKWDASFKRVNWDFHSVFGFYSCLILLIIALTGLTWAFDWYENGLYYLADGTTKRPSNKVENPTKIDPKLDKTFYYQDILNQTDSIYPFKGDTQIRIPNDTINSITVYKENLEKTIPNQSSTIYFDKYTTKSIAIRPFESFTLGEKIRRIVYPIHTGSIYGLPTKIIAFIVCLFAATSPITGFIIWYGRKKKTKKSGK